MHYNPEILPTSVLTGQRFLSFTQLTGQTCLADAASEDHRRRVHLVLDERLKPPKLASQSGRLHGLYLLLQQT